MSFQDHLIRPQMRLLADVFYEMHFRSSLLLLIEMSFVNVIQDNVTPSDRF